MKAVVTWADEQPDPTTITVRFHPRDDGGSRHEEHERAWEHFQSRAYGVAAASLPATRAVAADDEDRVTQPAERTRLLSLPEAFYLLTADTKWLAAPTSFGSLGQIWRRFSSASTPDQRFQRHFVVQFHFRQLGWVLKSGLNYGAHYVLYRGAASEFHSEYIVYVKEQPQEQLPWGVVQALTRVAADVKKTVLICDVACEELQSMDGVVLSDLTTSTLTDGKYAFYGQQFHFTAVAMRFWDVSGTDSQSGEQQQLSFAFQPQSVLLKKKKPQKRKAQDELLHKQTGGGPQDEPEVQEEAREQTRELLLVRAHALVHEDDGERADVAVRVAQDGHEEHGPPVAREPLMMPTTTGISKKRSNTTIQMFCGVSPKRWRTMKRLTQSQIEKIEVVRLDLRHERWPERQAAHKHKRDQQLQVEHLLEHGPLGRRRDVHRSVALGVGPLALSLYRGAVVISDQQMRLLGQLDALVELREHVLVRDLQTHDLEIRKDAQRDRQRPSVKVDQRRQDQLVGGEHELREVPVEAVDERGGDRHGGRAAQHRGRIRALRGQEEVRRRDEHEHDESADAIFQRVAQALGGGGRRRGYRIVAELRARERQRLR